MFEIIVWNVLITALLALLWTMLFCLSFFQMRPSLRHMLWLLLLVNLITPPFFSIPILPADSVEATVEPIAPPPLVEENARDTWEVASLPEAVPMSGDEPAEVVPLAVKAEAPSPVVSPPLQIDLATILLGTSLLITSLLLTHQAYRALIVWRWLKRGGAYHPRLAESVRDVGQRLGIGKPVASLSIDVRTIPMLWGIWRPTVVMPSALVDELDDDQLQSIVTHELSHLVRRDPWTNAFAFGIKVLLWWNPVTWWAHRKLREAQEHCCDAMAIQLSDRRCYAQSLLQTLDFVQQEGRVPHALALGMGERGTILRRFEMIADKRLSAVFPRRALPVLFAITLVGLCIPVAAQKKVTKTAKGETTGPSELIIDLPAGSQAGVGQGKTVSAPEKASKKLASAEPKSVFLSAVLNKQNADGQSVPHEIWLLNHKTGLKSKHHQGDRVQIGKEHFAINKIHAKSIEVRVRGKALQWQLGHHFGQVAAQAPAKDEKGPQKETPKVGVRVEVIGDNLIVKGKKDDVKQVLEILKKIEDGVANEKEPSKKKDDKTKTLSAYRLRTLDPKTVMDVLQTLLAEIPGTRLAIDSKSGNLIVYGTEDTQKVVRDVLTKLGDGKVIGSDAKKTTPPARFRISMKQVPWADVLKWFAEQSNLTLVMDESVPGTFTYQSKQNHTMAEALDVLNSVLLTKGWSLVRRKNMLVLVDLDKEFATELIPHIELAELNTRGNFEIVRVLMPLSGADPKSVQKEIMPLLGKTGRAEVLPKSKQLMIIDRAANLRTIKKIIDAMQKKQ